ncbi:MAG TPA: DUF5412 family protein [Bacillales bacterium]|nr:DUF5412 family protein [Bacillales bacterium]
MRKDFEAPENPDKEIKKANRYVQIGCLSISIVFLLLIGFIIYHYFFSMSSLPEGTFVESYESPGDTYILKIYRVNGGATVDFVIRGELLNKKTGETKNIYWNEQKSKVKVRWINKFIVEINKTKLDVRKDTFDFRQQ